MKSLWIKSLVVLAAVGTTTAAHAANELRAHARCTIVTEDLVTHARQTKEVNLTLEDLGSPGATAGQMLAEIQGTTLRLSAPPTAAVPVLALEVTNPSLKSRVVRELNMKDNILVYELTQALMSIGVQCGVDLEK